MQSKDFIKWLQGQLRGVYRKWGAKSNVLLAARAGRMRNVRTNRLAYHYSCAACKGIFPQSMVEVDHIIPVVDPHEGFVDWNTYVARLFVREDRLQVLCNPCHDTKTKLEGEIRRERPTRKISKKRKNR